MKPRIKKERSLWVCSGMRLSFLGTSPKSSYYGWLSMREEFYKKHNKHNYYYYLFYFALIFTGIYNL